MNFLFRQQRTFKPHRNIPEGTKQHDLMKHAQNTLGSGNLRLAVQLPEGEDLNEWIAVNIVDFFNQINMLYGTITEFCTETTCVLMTAGPKYEYHWADGQTIKKPIKCSAPRYIDYLMSWVQDQLDDELIFPSKIGVPFPKNFLLISKTILKRLFRVYAHIYHQHFKEVVMLKEEAHLNTSFKHFVYFIQEFSLVEKKELAPLQELIDRLTTKDHYQRLKYQRKRKKNFFFMSDIEDMSFSLLNKSHNHLLTYRAFEQVRLIALRHYWIPNSIIFHIQNDDSQYALEFSLETSNEHYYLYIPWNVDDFTIKCHISCRKLADDGYAWTIRMLDRILRLLCDHCPGLFQLEYKNGLFGRQNNRLIIYNGLANLCPMDYSHWKQRVQLQYDRLSPTRQTTTILADIEQTNNGNEYGIRSIKYQTLGHGKILNETYYDWYV
ncbi:unnamed protein product [Rotaria sordida]|uniref:Uncharacterized protein n=1 Tax=Rotaria sordida TaxID=392033 RepID=A0A815H242_9BILA|nr:unnamed protein product [Rotaria sordida]CAF1346142.1 unnamed protein product [Rotaria sordida]